ncbi:hypothetical protein HOK51_07190 [Candidatus Woesearchaeota archaeon]|jgi:HTH-type transcriptional regulator, sugar sensing transcriptional regulator|nr:hypothetical protein [Candidatus Woesearchaeota archaeon]MBT6519606.1 hypothetical protein [Candidatus Woesearchaeota archaeon]MBT7367521.1 hypothetical protein [Candidatus Woesearchaeota archaeon]
MLDKIIVVLKELGFEQREIKIYLTIIKLQNQTALQISKQTEIDRTTTYDLLEKMTQKGIVAFKLINNAKHFTVLKPDQLLVYFKEKYTSLENIIPKLNAITELSDEPINCELFQGLNGLKTVLRDLISSKKNYYVIGIKKKYEDILKYFNDQGVIRLDEFNVKETAIVSKKEKFKKLANGSYKYLDAPLSADLTTLIYDNTVIFFIWKNPYAAIRIKNKEFVKGQKEYFDLIWKIAK